MSNRTDDNLGDAIRMIRDQDNTYNIVIPPGLMNHNGGGLRLRVYCKTSVKELEKALGAGLPTPDYAGRFWGDNVKGSFDEIHDQTTN